MLAKPDYPPKIVQKFIDPGLISGDKHFFTDTEDQKELSEQRSRL